MSSPGTEDPGQYKLLRIGEVEDDSHAVSILQHGRVLLLLKILKWKDQERMVETKGVAEKLNSALSFYVCTK